MSFFVTKTVDEWGTSYSLTGAGYTALVVLILVLLLAACYLTGEKTAGTDQTYGFCRHGYGPGHDHFVPEAV